jgi:hypothetical protein
VISRTVEAIQGGHNSEQEGQRGVEKADRGKLGKEGILGKDQKGLVAAFESMCNIASDKKGRLSGATSPDRLSLYAYYKQVAPPLKHTLKCDVYERWSHAAVNIYIWKSIHLCVLTCMSRRRRAETVRQIGRGCWQSWREQNGTRGRALRG